MAAPKTITPKYLTVFSLFERQRSPDSALCALYGATPCCASFMTLSMVSLKTSTALPERAINDIVVRMLPVKLPARGDDLMDSIWRAWLEAKCS